MSLIIIIFINLVVISSSHASDHRRENVITLLRALRDFGNVRRDTGSRHILSDILSNLNSHVGTRLEPAPGNIDTHLDVKSKRGWEDFSKEWRRSPKRAWDVVRRLWKVPEIRTKYISFLKNGKRSEEVLENTPVQDANAIPEMILEETGFGIRSNGEHTERERKEIIQELMRHLTQSGTKRGWEDINIFQTRPFKRRLAAVGDSLTKRRGNKRGWEDFVWKRNVGDLSKHEEYIANVLSEIDNAKNDIVNIRPFDVVTLSNTDRPDEELYDYTNSPVFVLQ